jgi:hypothetical protein
VADPTVVAAREFLESSLGDLRGAVEGMPADTLNRRPAGKDTNAIAVLVTHAMGATRSWLSLAMGTELPPRDRPAEFEVVARDDRELLHFLHSMGADCRALLATDAPFDPARTGVPSWGQAGESEEPVTAAWALIHALEHLREHMAQAQLTRQLLERHTNRSGEPSGA